MPADMFRLLRLALVAVVTGDATLQNSSHMNRASKLIFPWKGLQLDGAIPVIAYQLHVFPQNGKDNDTRAGRIRFSIFADTLERCEFIAARLEALITQPALIAAQPTLDAVPLDVTRLYVNDETDEDEGTTNPAPARALERVDVDMDFELTQAA